MTKQYIGSSEIVKETELEVKTPLGSPIYRVELADKQVLNLTKRMLEASKTPAVSDLTSLSEQRGAKFVSEVVSLLNEWGVSDDDYTPWMQWVGRTVDVIRDKAFSKAIGVDSVAQWSLAQYQLILNEQIDPRSTGDTK